MKASPYETLQKILKLEREQGYRNRAVVGGLAEYADTWSKQARAASRRPEQSEQIAQIAATLRGYDTLSTEERAERLRAASAILHRRAPRPRSRGPLPEKEVSSGLEPSPSPKKKPSPKRRAPVDATDAILSWQELAKPVKELKGIGRKLAPTLAKLGIGSIRAFLFELRPRRLEDYRELRPLNDLLPDQATTVIGTVRETWNRVGRGGRHDFCLRIEDSSASLRVIFFGQRYLDRQIQLGMRLSLSGRPRFFRDELELVNPEWQVLEEADLYAGRIVPIYPRIEGFPPKTLRKTMRAALSEWAPRVPEPLPLPLLERCDLLNLDEALQGAHFPKSVEEYQQAARRLTFDQLLVWQLALQARRREWQGQPGPLLRIDAAAAAELPAQLFDFPLTAAQERVSAEICADLQRERPMIRLLQGDVGSGKTAIATLAMLWTQAAGAQAALMAPTSILAEQHFRSLNEALTRLPKAPSLALATAALSKKERTALRRRLSAGEIDLVVGTQALIQEGLEFQNLGLIVIDEQQRFGVAQRAALRAKGRNPHLLAMSATPFPRTLAMTAFADMDLSVLDEMPPGRQKVDTRIISPRERAAAYRLLSLELDRGAKAFVVHPKVQESEHSTLYDARRGFAWLRRYFPEKSVALLHGQQSAAEKEAIMREFAAGETDLLATTSVAEVGVDVPRASVILIEGANRFGLAQLHQLRGRVGRGGQAAYCLLVAESESDLSNERLRALAETNDGFALAERDWQLRGSGDFFGQRQSGYFALEQWLAAPSAWVELAQREARRIFAEDPTLRRDEHALLALMMKEILPSSERVVDEFN